MCSVTAAEIAKKKTLISRGGKKMKKWFLETIPHHKKARIFINMHKATRLHFLSMSFRYPMSESVQRDDQWSSLTDLVHFRYDDQHPPLPAEGLIKHSLTLVIWRHIKAATLQNSDAVFRFLTRLSLQSSWLCSWCTFSVCPSPPMMLHLLQVFLPQPIMQITIAVTTGVVWR
jgi:hypothetical protein